MIKKDVPYGSDASAGTYKCNDCGYLYSNQSKKSLPPCPQRYKFKHVKNSWSIITGQGDAPEDPYPNK